MSNIDKQALRQTAEKAQEHGVFNMDIHSQTVLALLDELEAKDKLNAELMEKQRLIDICQGQGLEHRIAAEKRAEAAEKRIADYQELISGLVGVSSSILREVERINKASAAGKGE